MTFIYLCVVRHFDRQFFVKIQNYANILDFLMYFYYNSCNFLCIPAQKRYRVSPLFFSYLTYHVVGNFEIKDGEQLTVGILLAYVVLFPFNSPDLWIIEQILHSIKQLFTTLIYVYLTTFLLTQIILSLLSKEFFLPIL